MSRPTTADGNGALPKARAVSGSMADLPPTVDAAPFEDTGPLHRALAAQGSDTSGVSAEQIASALISLGGGGGGGNGGNGGEAMAKRIKRGNWGTVLATLLTGLGITTASYFALVDRSKTNERRGEQNHQRIETIETDLGDVKKAVGKVGDTVDNSYRVQVQLVDKVEQLTSEQKLAREKSLREENKRLRDRLREERRR